jgi:hypothetical protein
MSLQKIDSEPALIVERTVGPTAQQNLYNSSEVVKFPASQSQNLSVNDGLNHYDRSSGVSLCSFPEHLHNPMEMFLVNSHYLNHAPLGISLPPAVLVPGHSNHPGPAEFHGFHAYHQAGAHSSLLAALHENSFAVSNCCVNLLANMAPSPWIRQEGRVVHPIPTYPIQVPPIPSRSEGSHTMSSGALHAPHPTPFGTKREP